MLNCLHKIESYLDTVPSDSIYSGLQSLAPVIQRIIDPSEHSDGMFRWVYDLTNNSELSWLNALNE
jgi:hypothetical protein